MSISAGAISFAPPTILPGGNGPFGVSLGDLNGDGRTDIAVVDYDGDTLSVFLASGSPGSFSSRVSYSTGQDPESVGIADFDSDGRNDILVGNTGSSHASLFLGAGSPGTFAAAVGIPVGGGSTAVLIDDFNQDSRMDFALSTHSPAVLVYLASGSPGSFAPAVAYPLYTTPDDPDDIESFPLELASGDINGDARPDIAVAGLGGTGGGFVDILLSSGGPGSFSAPVRYRPCVTCGGVAVHDVDMDGRTDVLTTDYFVGQLNNIAKLVVLPGAGAPGSLGTKRTYNIDSSLRPTGIYMMDLDADGIEEAVIPKGGPYIMKGTALGGFDAPIALDPSAYSYAGAVGDLNSDGLPDIVSCQWLADNIAIFINTSTPQSSIVDWHHY